MPKIKWTHATGEEYIEVDDWLAAHKNFLYARPVLNANLTELLKNNTRQDLAILFPIYNSSSRPQVEYFCKSAMWQLQSFLLYSDIVRERVPVYIVVSDKAYPIAEPYFEKANLPNSAVVTFSQGDNWLRNVLKFECSFLPFFDTFEKVVWCDVDNIIVGQPDWEPLPIAEPILNRWNIHTQKLLLATKLKSKKHQSNIANLKPEHPVWKIMSQAFNAPVEVLQSYWYSSEKEIFDVKGWLVGIPKYIRTNLNFQQWIRQWYPYLPQSDQALLELYAFSQNLTNTDICVASDFLKLYTYEDKERNSKDKCYLMHLSQRSHQ